MGEKELLKLSNVSKYFSGTRAISNIDFDLKGGEIHALVGENGAGKSTMVKVITGIHQPDRGAIELNGEQVRFNDVRDSFNKGIAAIYQDASLFENLSIAENIYMGHQEVGKIIKNIKWNNLYDRADALIESLDVKLDSRALVKTLSIAEKQLVEILKALSADAKILLMDEPTASLTREEIDYLFSITRRLKKEGKGIIYISHRLEEVFELSDRITVIRDGEKIGTTQTEDVNEDKLIQMMVGRKLDTLYPKVTAAIKDTMLEVKALSRAGEYKDVSFGVRSGEIVGIAGLVGAGRTEVACSIFGVTKPDTGKIFIEGKEISIDNPKTAMNSGLAYLSESRGEYGLILEMDITENITVTVLDNFLHYGWIDREAEKKKAKEFFDLLDIRASGLEQIVGSLSGGNQQKVAIAKWLAANAKIIILDEPTKGVDVGSKAAIHKMMSDLANEGKAILMISSEISEILGMSDRVLVMNEGRLVSEFTRAEATQEKILEAALGKKA